MKRYQFIIVPVLLLLLTILSSCGSDSSADDDGGKAVQTTETQPIEYIQSVQIAIRSAGSPKGPATYVSEVITVSCNVGEILSGGFCTCDHVNFDSSTTNFGQLAYCRAVDNSSVIGGCTGGLSESDIGKYGPPITVQAVCMSATTNTANIPSADLDEEQPLTEEAMLQLENMTKKLLRYQEELEKLGGTN